MHYGLGGPAAGADKGKDVDVAENKRREAIRVDKTALFVYELAAAWHMPTCRVGEARHPGPPHRVRRI